MSTNTATIPEGLRPPAQTDVHTCEECDEVLGLLAKAMRRARLRAHWERWYALLDSADAWLDERNLCVGALALHQALATTEAPTP